MTSKGPRKSKQIKCPESFITVQIHNQSQKNKFRFHRSSILNELKETELRLDESLNIGTKPGTFTQSNFNKIKRNMQSEKTFKIIPNSIYKGKNKLPTQEDFVKQKSLKKVKEENPWKISPEIRMKLKQLTNITQHFEKACEKKRQQKSYVCSTEKSYELPAVEETVTEGPQKENFEQQNRKKGWRQKLRKGKNLIQKVKENAVFYHRIKEQQLRKQQTEHRLKSAKKQTIETLKQRFLSPLINERKSAPVSQASTSFYNIFCAQKQSTACFYDRRVELQPINSLQQFASGGDHLPFQQNSKHVNVSSFLKNRQKLSFLEKIYNYAKQKCSNLKEIKSTQLQDPNLLAMIYYVENQSSMTAAERRYIKKKLDFID